MLVDRLNWRNIKAVVGSCKKVKLGRCRTEKRGTWDLYIGSLKEDVTAKNVMEYIN